MKHAECEERRKQQEKEEAARLYAAEFERLKTAPEYAALTQDKNGAVQVTSNIRKELKAKFLGVKFSVRKRGYDSVSVNWTDGPTEGEVKAVTDKYKDSYFMACRICLFPVHLPLTGFTEAWAMFLPTVIIPTE